MEFFEAWKNLKEIPTQIDEATQTIDEIKITVEVNVEPQSEINEDIVSGNPEDKYDEQTLEDWYNFASNIEGIIEKNFIIQNISLSKNVESLSQYFDFYRKDEDGNKVKGLVDLRLSDHRQTTNARRVRKNRVSKIDLDYRLVSVIVNGKQFKSYEEALTKIESLLNDLKDIKEAFSSDQIKITIKVPGAYGREETESYVYNSLENAKEAFKDIDEDDIISVSGCTLKELQESAKPSTLTESVRDKIYQIEDELNVEIDSLGDNKYVFNFIHYFIHNIT